MKQTPIEIACTYCIYFHEEVPGDDYGFCKRHAPTPIVTTENEEVYCGKCYTVHWPLVEIHDRCGEFKFVDERWSPPRRNR